MPPNYGAQHAPTVYSNELTSIGNGRAMWVPEPIEDDGQVEIGDVGFIESSNGNFKRLFNMLAEGGGESPEYGVPDCFEALQSHSNLVSRIPGYLAPGPYKSSSVKAVEVKVEAQGPAVTAQAGATVRFTCSRATGALLHLNDQGDRKLCRNNKVWPKYIFDNLLNWQGFLQQIPLELAIEELVIVRGYIKTSSWDAFAWTESTETRSIDLTAGVPGQGSIGGTFATTFRNESGPQHRRWPQQGPFELDQPGVATVSDSYKSRSSLPHQLTKDQTVFLSYYRIKRRIFFWTQLKAAGKYHSLEPPPPGSSSGGELYVDHLESDLDGIEWEDPLDQAIIYLFEQHAEAEFACVCDEDINCLLQGQTWPKNLLDRLRELTPQTEMVGENAVIFSVEDMVISSYANPGPPPGAGIGHAPGGDLPGPSTNEDVQMRERESFAPGREDIREGSITLGRTAQEQRTLKWPHTVLMEKQVDPGSPSAVAISRCGKFVAVGYEDSVIRLWHSEHEDPLFRLHQHSESVLCLAFSPDSRYLASGSSDTEVLFWDTDFGTIVRRFSAHSSDVWCLAFSPDGSILVTASTDMSLKFWSVHDIMWGGEEPEPYAELPDMDSIVQSVVFTPDSSKVISCTDQLGHIWDARTGGLHKIMQGHEGVIWVLTISHKGHRAATGSEDHSVRVWSTETGDELVTIRQHRAAVWSVQFSPTDAYVVAGSYDTTISIHHASTGECYHILSGHSSVVHAVAYSPVGELVASGSADGTIKLWDAKSGEQIAEMKGHADKIKSISFSPDHDSFFSSSNDGTVRVWSSVDVLRICDY